eukprot:scaffold9915_cov110-Cylindrotheca_fusiformis.AAC.4
MLAKTSRLNVVQLRHRRSLRIQHDVAATMMTMKKRRSIHHHDHIEKGELAPSAAATAAAATAGINEHKVPKLFKKDDSGTTFNYVYRVVLTGGPCGGKSTALNELRTALMTHGSSYDILCVPEVPTILMNGGCQYPGIAAGNKKKLMTFEKALMEAQLQLERSFVEIASSSPERPTIVFMDRGLMDVAAYLPEKTNIWNDTLRALNLTEKMIAQRYDLVLHLVTAADGAEEYYTLENNKEARKETPAQAREIDHKIRTCYERVFHSKVKVIDNSTDFKGKMKRATDFVLEYVK